jgi:hypothetical protein
LKLAFWVFVIVGATGSEQAQAIGVNGLRQPVSLEGRAEVAKVVPSRFGGNETTGNNETRSIVNGEQEELFFFGRPPLVNGTIVLP